ncbi:MAG: hypothetical protein Q8N23_26890 [Archangium sp.]|nr:hypothetical protein [Archangium sp.]MDP3156332.1 hypothetical protein [Archangium sp.]MDP3570376.1 hypothetical protein [Archangium sp.]
MRWLPVLLLLGACQEPKPAAPIPRAQPKPLEPLERVVVDAGDARDALYEVVPFTPVGPAVPSGARLVTLSGEKTVLPAGSGPVVLVPDEETYLAQIAALLATLADAKEEVWLQHPEAAIAFKLKLRDAPEFQAWIDEPVPGKLRVIQRADGFELQTNLGKLPGGDPNGPTVPLRGGKLDLTTLQRGFQRIQNKFKSAPDVCFVPSFGTELAKTAQAMSVNYVSPESAYFPQTCLVYPRPPAK